MLLLQQWHQLSAHSLKVCDWISPKPTKSPSLLFLLWHTASNHVICQKGTDTLLCRLSSSFSLFHCRALHSIASLRSSAVKSSQVITAVCACVRMWADRKENITTMHSFFHSVTVNYNMESVTLPFLLSTVADSCRQDRVHVKPLFLSFVSCLDFVLLLPFGCWCRRR